MGGQATTSGHPPYQATRHIRPHTISGHSPHHQAPPPPNHHPPPPNQPPRHITNPPHHISPATSSSPATISGHPPYHQAPPPYQATRHRPPARGGPTIYGADAALRAALAGQKPGQSSVRSSSERTR